MKKAFFLLAVSLLALFSCDPGVSFSSSSLSPSSPDGVSSPASSAADSSPSSEARGILSAEKALASLSEELAFKGTYAEKTTSGSTLLDGKTREVDGYITGEVYYVFDGDKDYELALKDAEGKAKAPTLALDNTVDDSRYWIGSDSLPLDFDSSFFNPFSLLDPIELNPIEGGYEVGFTSADERRIIFPSLLLLNERLSIEGLRFKVGAEAVESIEFIVLPDLGGDFAFNWSFTLVPTAVTDTSYREIAPYPELEGHDRLRAAFARLKEGNYTAKVSSNRDERLLEATSASIYEEETDSFGNRVRKGYLKVDEGHVRPYVYEGGTAKASGDDLPLAYSSFFPDYALDARFYEPLGNGEYLLHKEGHAYLEHNGLADGFASSETSQAMIGTYRLALKEDGAMRISFLPDVLYEGEIEILISDIGSTAPRLTLDEVPPLSHPTSWEGFDPELAAELSSYLDGHLDLLPYVGAMDGIEEIYGIEGVADYLLVVNFASRDYVTPSFEAYLDVLEEAGYSLDSHDGENLSAECSLTVVGEYSVSIGVEGYESGSIELTIVYEDFETASDPLLEFVSAHFGDEYSVNATAVSLTKIENYPAGESTPDAVSEYRTEVNWDENLYHRLEEGGGTRLYEEVVAYDGSFATYDAYNRFREGTWSQIASGEPASSWGLEFFTPADFLSAFDTLRLDGDVYVSEDPSSFSHFPTAFLGVNVPFSGTIEKVEAAFDAENGSIRLHLEARYESVFGDGTTLTSVDTSISGIGTTVVTVPDLD